MIYSMTGFATKTFTLTTPGDTKSNITISIKSLNSRFFEVSAKLPYQLTQLETKIAKSVKKKLLRGHIYCIIHMSNPNAFSGKVEGAVNVARNYAQAIQDIQKAVNIEGSLTLDTLIRLPNMFAMEEGSIDTESEQLILNTVETLIDTVMSERAQEGASLKKDLDKRLQIMRQEIDTITVASQKLVEQQKDKIKHTLQELGENDDDSFTEVRKNALYAMLDKIDIHEEIVRFKSHLENIATIIASPDCEKGKRLDFTLQELAREINTITAKCSDATIGTHAINVKVEIEKAREQAQNLV